ncbi:hypothetical protein ACFIQG_20540 [Comamonas odontotermitis]|uniref:hypothetical protein n=1 Tax=Comamonas odontotermitis TaxID=379895 RepID=UPI00366AD836
MNASVSVLHLQPHDELSAFLDPVAQACRFENIPAVHVVPLRRLDGQIAGVVDSFSDALNCVKIDINITKHETSTRYVYLHECSHLLLRAALRKAGHDMDAHGPSFLLILMSLAHRVDSANLTNQIIFDGIDLYDYQDCPPFMRHLHEYEWRPLILAFALMHYKRLANSDLSAEKIGEEARRLWMKEGGPALYKPTLHAKQLQTTLSNIQEELEAAQTQLQRFQSHVSGSFFFVTVTVSAIFCCAITAYIMRLFFTPGP